MAVLQLPPETLTQIFDYLEPSFREDLGRLTICKQWFEYAHPIFFKKITLSPQSLVNFVQQSSARPSPEESKIGRKAPCDSLQDFTEDLDLDLWPWKPIESTKSPPEEELAAAYLERRLPRLGATDVPLEKRSRLIWFERERDSLANLALFVQQSRKLRRLRIRGWDHPRLDDSRDTPKHKLPLERFKCLLSAENLTILVLDLPVGIEEEEEPSTKGQQHQHQQHQHQQHQHQQHQQQRPHICPIIGSLLSTLQTLHLRMRTICPEALQPPDGIKGLALRSVVINLSLAMNNPDIRSSAYACRCMPSSGGDHGGLPRLQANMRKQAGALASRMTSPALIRILTHSVIGLQMLSLDVLTGKAMMLDDDAAWDVDGETSGDDGDSEESELLDDNFLGWLDD